MVISNGLPFEADRCAVRSVVLGFIAHLTLLQRALAMDFVCLSVKRVHMTERNNHLVIYQYRTIEGFF